MTKELGRPVLVSDATRALLTGGSESLEFVEDRTVRGKAESVRLWTLNGPAYDNFERSNLTCGSEG